MMLAAPHQTAVKLLLMETAATSLLSITLVMIPVLMQTVATPLPLAMTLAVPLLMVAREVMMLTAARLVMMPEALPPMVAR